MSEERTRYNQSPIKFGDTKDIVAILHLNYEGLEFLATLNIKDGFVRECADILKEVDRFREPGEVTDV